MIFFWVFEDFWGKIAKEQIGKSRHIGLLRHNVGNPRRDVDLRRRGGGGGPPRCQNWHPSGTPRHSFEPTPQRSSAMPRRIYCSQGTNFRFLFLNTSYSYTDSLRTLINV